MPLTQAEVDALRNATRGYGGTVEVAPRAQYVDPNVQARFDDLAARVAGTPTPAPARAAVVPDVQAQFNALAERIAPQTIQNAPAGQVAPVQREGVRGAPNYYNVPGAAEAYEQYGVPPMLFQRDPYATAGYMAGPDGSVRPLVGYPSRYPHVLNGVPQNYAAPYLQNAWGMLGPWIAPPNPAAVQQLVDVVRPPRVSSTARAARSASPAKATAPAAETPAATEEANPLMGPNAGPQFQNPAMGPNAGPQRILPQFTQGDVFNAAIQQSQSPYVRDMGQFDYDEYGTIVPGGRGYDIMQGSTVSYADPYTGEIITPPPAQNAEPMPVTPGLGFAQLMNAVEYAKRLLNSEQATPETQTTAPSSLSSASQAR